MWSSYIFNQERHHAKKSFRTECLTLLMRFDIAYDRKYLFGFFDGESNTLILRSNLALLTEGRVHPQAPMNRAPAAKAACVLNMSKPQSLQGCATERFRG